MGRKGANKLKPKKSKSLAKENTNISSITHPGSNSVQSLIKNSDSGKAKRNSTVSSNKKGK